MNIRAKPWYRESDWLSTDWYYWMPSTVPIHIRVQGHGIKVRVCFPCLVSLLCVSIEIANEFDL